MGLFGTVVQKSAARISDKRRGPRFSLFPRFQFKRSLIAWWAGGKRALDADRSAGFFLLLSLIRAAAAVPNGANVGLKVGLFSRENVFSGWTSCFSIGCSDAVKVDRRTNAQEQ